MRHLLVVDDEPNLADGLCLALAEAFGDEIDISKAYSGKEALEILSKSPVDLVITDVRMPDINGLDLMKIIHERRMGCRILILTGYDEFDAIHKAVKMPLTTGFLLKNEGDEEIIKAVRKSLSDIEKAERNQLDIALAKRQSKALDTLLRERRLWNILGVVLPFYDESTSSSETILGIDVSKPLLLIVVRSFSAYISSDTIIWLEEQVNRLFGSQFALEMSIFGYSSMAWLLQEKEDADIKYSSDAERSGALRTGMLEIQSRLANNGTKVSVALVSKWIQVPDLPAHVHTLRNVLRNMSISGQHQQVIDLSADEQDYPLSKNADSYILKDRYIHRATNALLEGNEREWEAAVKDVVELSKTDYSAITRLLSSLVDTNNSLGFSPISDIPRLLSPDNDYGMLNAAGLSICRMRKQFSKYAVNDVISRIHETIENKLGSPTLSVTSIAMETYYNPSYLSRLYKSHTGSTIMETINDIRIRRACKLLKDPALKISDISKKIGYASPSSFTFFFRKKMGITPKEFRINNLNLTD